MPSEIAISISSIAKYIGFRLNLNTPPVANEVAALGFSGLIVVCKRLKARIAATIIARPAVKKTTAKKL